MPASSRPGTALDPGLDPRRAALVVVDVQPDFLPGGPLAVADGDDLLEPLARLMRDGPLPLQVATQDWHPAGHVSFASSHDGRDPFDTITLHGHDQTLWPDHCIQGSDGAALHPALPWEAVAAVIRKGTDPDTDSYSGFRNNWSRDGARPPAGLAGYQRDRQVEAVFVCGVARDICVRWTALDAAEAGLETYFVWDLTRPVEPEADEGVRKELAERGVTICEAGALYALGGTAGVG